MERPDTQIKLFTKSDAKTMQGMRKEFGGRRDVTLLRLDESASGNSFSRPYNFIAVRDIPEQERLPRDLKNDGDPMSDFFDTMRRSSRIKTNVSTVGHVFLGFKVLDNDRNKVLDVAWQDWTGTSELLRALDRRRFVLKRVSCLKAVNVKPDIFKYCVFVEIAGQESTINTSMDPVLAKAYLQKFRSRRMCGYVGMYKEYHPRELEDAILKQQSIDSVADLMEISE